MKLYKPVEASEIFKTGITHKQATLSDIRASAKEMGYAVVPFEPSNAMIEEVEHASRMGAFWTAETVYKAMIKAAEDEQ